MTAWGKVAACFAAAALFWGFGFWVASQHYGKEMARMQAEAEAGKAQLTEEYRAKEQSQTKQLADAWDALERSRAESVNLRNDVERVRVEANKYRKQLSGADADTSRALRERLDRCVGLLEEGAELSAEGAGLSQRIAAKHDALVKIRLGN